MQTHKLANHKVYIVGPGREQYIQMFLSRGFKGAKDLEEADIVCFTGGSDVNPRLYEEKALDLTHYNDDRDNADIDAYLQCDNKIKVGICRGGQFLNVMNGGTLWQDVNNHTRPHFATDLLTGKAYFVSSTHHQQMRPAPRGNVLAVGHVGSGATKKLADEEFWEKGITEDGKEVLDPDVEAVWYAGTKSLCFQPHPEFYAYPECTNYFFELLERCAA